MTHGSNTFRIVCQETGVEYLSSGDDVQDAIINLLRKDPMKWSDVESVAVGDDVYPITVNVSIDIAVGKPE